MSGWVTTVLRGTRPFAVAILVASAAVWAPMAVYKLKYPSYSWHQRLTITIATPEGDVTGSSVAAVKWYANPARSGSGLGDGAAFFSNVQAEATVVDTKSQGTLFAVLGTMGTFGDVAFLPLLVVNKTDYWAEKTFRDVIALTKKGPLDVPSEFYPMFVSFRDKSDPSSIEKVEFKSGELKIKRVAIEVVDEPVSGGIEKILPWLTPGYPEQGVVTADDGLPLSKVPPARRLTYQNFQRRS